MCTITRAGKLDRYEPFSLCMVWLSLDVGMFMTFHSYRLTRGGEWALFWFLRYRVDGCRFDEFDFGNGTLGLVSIILSE